MRRPGSGRPRGALLGGLLLALFAWGCEGHNLFQPGVGVGPEIVELQLPASVRSGEALPLQVRAVGVVRVDSIVVQAEGGDFSLREVAAPGVQETEIAAAMTFEIPEPVTDTLVVITARAYDAQHNASRPRVDTVRAVDTTPPGASVAVAPEAPGLGGATVLSVTGTDNVGLRWVGIHVFAADSAPVFSDSVRVGGREATVPFAWEIPETLPSGEYVAAPFAVDLEGNRSELDLSPFPIEDQVAPGAAILRPDPGTRVEAADSILVRARVTDNEGVARVTVRGVALVGDRELGTDRAIERFTSPPAELAGAPADTVIQRLLRFVVPSEEDRPETPMEDLAVIVAAEDLAGNVSADTVILDLRHDVHPPNAAIVRLLQDGFLDAEPPLQDRAVRAETPLTVRARVSDLQGTVRSGVHFVSFDALQITGSATTGDLVVRPLAPSVDFHPQDPGIVFQRTLEGTFPELAESEAPDGVFFLVVTVRDRAGNVGADTVRLRTVPPEPPQEEVEDPGEGGELVGGAQAGPPHPEPRR